MIYQANREFPFDKLTLVPSTIVNGSFFTKYLISETHLYIQAPKCFSKNGLVKTGKRMFCDLIFIRENEQFIQWIEHLEIFTQKYIYDNREKWFETTLEMTDIEDSFTQIMKSYKSGKNYLIRTNVPTKSGGICSLKIYDENANNIDSDTITDKNEMMTILEIQGVKCSSKSFQIEIEIKQIMILNPVDPFEKCVFKTSPTTTGIIDNNLTLPNTGKKNFFHAPAVPQISVYDKSVTSTSSNFEDIPTPKPKTESGINIADTKPDTLIDSELSKNDNELCEVEFDLEELPTDSETIQIKTRNDVYYEMYKEAKRKAKIARDLALSSYLEAKRIKNTYMLDDIDDSDDEDEDEDDNEFEDSDNEFGSESVSVIETEKQK